jgi:hypothetical protein
VGAVSGGPHPAHQSSYPVEDAAETIRRGCPGQGSERVRVRDHRAPSCPLASRSELRGGVAAVGRFHRPGRCGVLVGEGTDVRVGDVERAGRGGAGGAVFDLVADAGQGIWDLVAERPAVRAPCPRAMSTCVASVSRSPIRVGNNCRMVSTSFDGSCAAAMTVTPTARPWERIGRAAGSSRPQPSGRSHRRSTRRARRSRPQPAVPRSSQCGSG